MALEEINLKVKKIIIDVLDLEVTPDSLQDENLIEAYGLNSVDALEILMHVENTFEIEIDEEDLTAELVNSTPSLASYIETRAA